MPYRLSHTILAVLVTIATAAAQRDGEIMSASMMAFSAFPEADTVRPIVRNVKQEERRQIESRLPFRVHFEELGEHRLYVAFRARKPVGLLYTRSEATEWGLADIGWSMSLEGEVVGFEFANSRSRKATAIGKTPFARSLIGRKFHDLKAMYYQGRARPSGETDDELAGLARTVLRSALKATVVTDVVWQTEIAKLADIAMLLEEFPGVTRHQRTVAQLPQQPDGHRDLLSLRHMQANSRSGISFGSVTRTAVLIGDEQTDLRWVLDSRFTIIAIKPVSSWPNAELRHACSLLRGHRLDEDDLPDTPLTQAAHELRSELERLNTRRGRK